MKNAEAEVSPPPCRYAFGEFVLEQAPDRLLRTDGTPVALTPRLFSALLLFVRSSGNLLDKDSLLAALWPGMVVEENNLNQVVHALRRALGDDGIRFIQTVPRKGFRFVAPVRVGADDTSAPAPAPEVEQPAAAAAPREAPAGLPAGVPHIPRRRVVLATGALCAAAGLAWWRLRPASPGAPASATTVAVLPFSALSTRAGDLPLAIGMADSLIARLSLAPGLVVRAFSSVFDYAGTSPDPLLAARDQAVNWIVDGSLHNDGDQLRVRTRLLRAPDGSPAWNGRFNERLSGIFDIHERIAANLLAQVRAQPRTEEEPESRALPERGGTQQVDAYRLYLAALIRYHAGFPDGADQSIALLRQALDVDPDYALAWTLLADCHRYRALYQEAEPSDAFGLDKPAVERALVLEPKLSRARAALAFRSWLHEFDWERSENEFRVALSANPNEVNGHLGLGALLAATRARTAEGLAHLRTAAALDRRSPFLKLVEATFFIESGRLDEARLRIEQVLRAYPKFWIAHAAFALLQFSLGHDGSGIAALRSAVALEKETTRAKALLGAHLARLGQADEARAILQYLLSIERTRFVRPTSIAAVQAALGDTGEALSSLELAAQMRDPQLVQASNDPLWKPLRSEDRFIALVRTMKLPPYDQGFWWI